MLKLPPRGELDGLRGLSEQEDRALRDAFGRWPEPGARSLFLTKPYELEHVVQHLRELTGA